MNPEKILIVAGVAALLAGTVLAWRPAAFAGTARGASPTIWLSMTIILIGGGIGLRWSRLGHGPFFNMFEILASNVFSLGLICLLAWRFAQSSRPAWLMALPVLSLMGLWLVTLPGADSHYAPTYATTVLWFHVIAGKLFLGSALIALGLATVILLRRAPIAVALVARLQTYDDGALDHLAWQWMRVALVFESAMLVAGAVWAQDAWGRYWAWDPLETWAFITWLVLVAAVHQRVRRRPSPALGAAWIGAVFVLAFLTFFGVPFVTMAPHQGAV